MGERDALLRAAVEEAEETALREPEVALAALDDLDVSGLRSRDPALAARIGYLRARLLATVRGSYDEAMGAIRAARRDWLASGNALDALASDLGRASVLHDIGEHQQAVSVTQTLLSRLTTAVVPPDREDDAVSIRARAHHNLGNAWSGLGDHDQALRNYDLAANLYSAIGWRRLQAETDANRGLTYLRLGMAHRALAELGAAVRALRAEGHEVAALRTEVDLADAHLSLDDAASALWLLQAVQSRLLELNAAPDLARLRVVLAQSLSEVGMAEQAHREAITAYELFTDLTMVTESARALTVAAWSSHLLGAGDRALAEVEVALSMFADSGNRLGEALARLVLAQLEAARGQRQRARDLVAAAVLALEDLNDHVNACHGHLLEAELSTHAEATRAHLERAAELVQSLDVPVLAARLALGRARYDRSQGDLDSAADRLRAALLRSSRTHRPPVAAPELEAVTAGARDEALSELLDVLLSTGTNTSAVAAWQWANWSKSRLVRDLTSASGPAAAWQDPQELDVLAGPLLQYHLVGPDVVAFVVRDAQVHVRRLPGATETTRHHVSQWEAACALRRLDPGHTHLVPRADGDHPALEALHAILVDPLADLLEDEPGAPLLVTAHRHLYAVPFEALHDGGEPFGLSHQLAFSAAVGPSSATVPPRRDPEESTLVLAVPDERAPAILHDAMLVTALRPDAEVYVGARATAQVLRERGAAHDIVHIASHAEFDPVRPFDSTLLLADGPVTSRDLRGFDLGGSLVFLAACDGGRASDAPSGPAGLAWSLLAAGARSVLAAKWSVDDEATSAFVRCFYSHLAAGRGFHAAAHAARTDLARAQPDPYHWAAFRLICAPSTALGDALAP